MKKIIENIYFQEYNRAMEFAERLAKGLKEKNIRVRVFEARCNSVGGFGEIEYDLSGEVRHHPSSAYTTYADEYYDGYAYRVEIEV